MSGDLLGDASANRRREIEAAKTRPPAGVTASHVGHMVTALNEHGELLGIGPMSAYNDKPSAELDTLDGRTTYAAAVCRAATPDEVIDYWRERSERAEREVGRLNAPPTETDRILDLCVKRRR